MFTRFIPMQYKVIYFLSLRLQTKLAKFEQLLDDVSAHCLHHNEIMDVLKQIAAALRQIHLEEVNGSEDAKAAILALEEISSKLDSLQGSVEACLQRSKNLLPSLAQQDVDVIVRQSQVCLLVGISG